MPYARHAINQLQFYSHNYKVQPVLPFLERSSSSRSASSSSVQGVHGVTRHPSVISLIGDDAQDNSVNSDNSDSDFEPFSSRQQPKPQQPSSFRRSYSDSSAFSHTSTSTNISSTINSSRYPKKADIDVSGSGDAYDAYDTSVYRSMNVSVDSSFSSLQSVAKLVNAALNIHGKLDFDPDLVFSRFVRVYYCISPGTCSYF